jgi:uncharacterized protein
MHYQPGAYRNWVKNKDLISFRIIQGETDCLISAGVDLENKARRIIDKYRRMLKKYIDSHPQFLTTLEPLEVEKEAPRIIRLMSEASHAAKVGPMASVAGAIAQFTGEELAPYSHEIIVENGGDIYINSKHNRLIGIYAGDSPLSGKIGFELQAKDFPLGIGTSSGTVGHSLSFGKADAVIILAKSAILADAAATSTANIIFTAGDIAAGIEHAKNIRGTEGIIIIKDEKIGIYGKFQIKRIETA